MIKYALALFSVVLLFSCSFQRTKLHKGGATYCVASSSDPVSIYKALSISTGHVKAKTAIYNLEGGGQSLIARLWFFEHAQKSIDVQYYSFSHEVTGLIACERLVCAADRGVKVRILIDDAACRMYSKELKLLDLHDNIEVSVYNAGLMLGRPVRRVYKFTDNYKRLLRRMHNKTVTVDGEATIMGGRNIADQYFDYDRNYNFRDRDVLLLGNAVDEVKDSYEKFWNDSLTVRYSELSGKNKKEKKKDLEVFGKLHGYAAETKNFSKAMRDKVKAFPEEIKAASASGELVWVTNTSFIADKPGKNEDKNWEGGICTDSIISLIKQAKTSIDIESPYFITAKAVKQLLKEAIQRGVKIRLTTNSLASTDNCEAFNGYKRDRNEILEIGVLIYEFRPDAKVRFKLMVPEIQAALKYKPVFGFHCKTIVIDGLITVIGSYNFDPRSANYNTECISIIRSAQVAKNVSKYIDEEFLPENSWQITKDYNPDTKAGIKKRIKAAASRVFQKNVM